MKRITYLFFAIGFYCFCGCSIFRQQVEKNLVSMWIPRDQVDVIKSTILSEGYERVTKENYPYKGAMVTQYSKKGAPEKEDFGTRIYLSFRTDAPNLYFKNFGIWIHGMEYKNMPEIKAEVNRIETILYEKLVEASGKENVKRGYKEIHGRGSVIADWKKMGDRYPNWPPWKKSKIKEPPKVLPWDQAKVKKEITALWIPRDQIAVIKGAISEEGYQRTGEEDIFYTDDSIVTEYTKDVPTAEKTRHVQIKVAFQETYTPKDYYRDLVVTLLNFERQDIPEVNAEVNRMETILYEKLVGVSGKENVKRGMK